MSTPSFSASSREPADGRTLKPTMIASEAIASVTSFSVIPPAPARTMFTRTSSCGSFSNESSRACTDPWTSAFTMMLSSVTASDPVRRSKS